MPARPRRPSARVATRTGDGGETSLFGKERVRKTDPRIEALGDLDETQAVIGLARSLAPRSSLGRQLLELQRGLYLLMAEVATPHGDLGRLKERLEQTPGAKIPELQFATDKDWLNAARGELETDSDYRRALSTLRSTAENKVAEMMKKIPEKGDRRRSLAHRKVRRIAMARARARVRERAF